MPFVLARPGVTLRSQLDPTGTGTDLLVTTYLQDEWGLIKYTLPATVRQLHAKLPSHPIN